MLTIFVPCLFYTSPNAPIIFSTFLFFSGIYLTVIYILTLYYKEGKEKLEKEHKKLQKEMDVLIREKEELLEQLNSKAIL